MKKNLSLLLIFCGVFFSVCRAGVISVDDARTVAINFFKVNADGARGITNLSANLNYTRTETDNTVDYYVFDMAPAKGFVIVAADDNIKPVIAYSTESYFSSNLTQTGVVDWMKHAAEHIVMVKQLHVMADAKIKGLWTAYRAGTDPILNKSAAVTPMVKTVWNQEPKYNAFCPYNTVDKERAVTGCVATAMAQIMKFWNFPATGVGSNSYDAYYYGSGGVASYDYGTQSVNFAATTYNWTGMPNAIGNNDTAIALLMYHAGVSVDMNYGDDLEDGSGAEVLIQDAGGYYPSAQSAFAKNFSYDANMMQGLYESNYHGDSAGWYAILKGELDKGRPFEYVGDDQSAGGHTWVCDGYDANNMLHMNWGWGGASNGYFAASNLDAEGYNFNQHEEALIGIVPVRASAAITTSATQICTGDTARLQGVANSTTFSWTPTTGLSCPTCQNTLAMPMATTTYTLVIDSNGVQGVATVTVTVKQGPGITNGNVTNATCDGTANGAATVSASGGTPGYTYLWSDGATTAVDTNMLPGVYYVSVTDAAGCKAATIQVVGAVNPAIVVTPVVTSAGCKAANGSASLSASGGAGSNYTFTWANGSTGDELSNVAAGNYAVTVSDGTCTTVSNVAITQQDQLSVVINTTEATDGANGSATVETVSGGNGPYTYDWLTAGSTAQTATGLSAGNYPVVVTDASGCYDTTTAVISVATAITPVTDGLSLSVYPNPSHGTLFVQLSKLSSGTTLKVENVLGQTMISKPVTDLQTQLDLSSFASGVYLVEISQAGKRAVKQVVVNK